MGVNYYALFQLAEMGAAKRAGLIKYTCTYAGCEASYSSDRVMTNGDVQEVSEQEARSKGLVFESQAQA